MGGLSDILAALGGGNQDMSQLNQIAKPTGPQIPQSGTVNSALNSPPPPQMAAQQTHGIKGYLSDMFYQMGEAGKKSVGLPTDYEKQQAQQKLQLQQQQTQADILEKQAHANWLATQTATNTPAPIMDQQEADSLGLKVGDMISPAQKSAIIRAMGPARLRANATVDAARIRALAQQNQVTMRAAYLPDGQTMGVGLYNKTGQFVGYADNAIVPAEYLEKIHHGMEFKVDANGTLQEIPTTSTTAPAIPRAPNQLIGGPAKPNAGNVQNLLQAGANRTAASTPIANGPNAKPVSVNGQPFQAPAAANSVYAFDPQTNQTIATTRGDAASKGLQIETEKVSPVQYRKDQTLSNRLADVQRKVGDYADTFNEGDLDSNDKLAIAYLMDHDIGAGLSAKGISLQVIPGYIQDQLKAKGMQALSDLGMRRYILFNQARESLSGYQQILTNSSRMSDRVLQLQLEQLAPPLANRDFAQTASSEFQKNLDLAGQHIPVFPGKSETQQSIKGQQQQRVQSRRIAEQKSADAPPPRPANVPANYVFKRNGPKGTGWYRP